MGNMTVGTLFQAGLGGGILYGCTLLRESHPTAYHVLFSLINGLALGVGGLFGAACVFLCELLSKRSTASVFIVTGGGESGIISGLLGFSGAITLALTPFVAFASVIWMLASNEFPLWAAVTPGLAPVTGSVLISDRWNVCCWLALYYGKRRLGKKSVLQEKVSRKTCTYLEHFPNNRFFQHNKH